MAEGLTKKDSIFIDEYFNNGFNGSKAYAKAFGVEQGNASSTHAFRLMSRPYIKVVMEERWKEIRDANIVTREEVLTNLKNLMQLSVEKKDNKTLLKTIDILNKMMGSYTTIIDATVHQDIKLSIPGLEIKDEKEEDED